MKADGAITWLGGHRRLVFRLVLLWLFMCSAAATALIVLMLPARTLRRAIGKEALS